MATRKQQPLKVQVPRNLVSAARARVRPSDNMERGQEIRDDPAFSILNNTVRNYKDSQNVIQLIRHLARAEGPFSTAVHNMVEVATTKYKVFAYDNATQDFSVDGTLMAMNVMSRMDTPTDYEGVTQKKSIDSVLKMAVREAILTGIVAGELVLDKTRMPDYIQLVGGETLGWASDGKGGAYPEQRVAGENDPVSLNIPNFFFSHLNPDPNTVTPRSMMEACIKMLVYFSEFLEDIQRSVRVAGHNRVVVSIDVEKVTATAPREVKSDPKKLADYLEEVRSSIETIISNIDPEQSLVMFNTAEADVLQSGTGSKIDYSPLLNVVIGQYATALKTPPSVLGLRLEGGSQQLGSIETLMFVKSAKTVHTPVETFFSRVLTLACRLFGMDIHVWFRLDPIDLRPEHEVEAFLTMRESRILDRLSLGLISDDEAAVELNCFPRPPGAQNLSGTMFRHQNKVETHPGDTPMGRSLQPDRDAPRKAGGSSQ